MTMNNRITKTLRGKAGFTLVELIVVIAILGILAGVGTVGYSGYIKKANMAADQQLIAVLNQAFSAACLENGVAQNTITKADAPVTDKKVTTIDVTAGADDAVMTKIEDAFVKYFGADGATFKVVEELKYSKYLGFYSDLLSESYSYDFAGSTITLNAADVAILSGDNAFKDRGSAALLADVGTLQNLIDSGAGEDVLTAVKQSDDFLWALGSYAGMTQGENELDDDYLEKVAAYMMDTNNKDAVYSAQIMYAASSAANTTDTQINTLFNGEKAVTSSVEVKNADGTTNNKQTMANAALAYGMYTAYVQQYPDADNVDNFTLTVNSDAFNAYYNSAQGQADLEAYMAAMNMISDNTSNSAITSSILENGIIGNAELTELMQAVMGN